MTEKKIAPGQTGMSLQGFEGSYFVHFAKVLCGCSSSRGRPVRAHHPLSRAEQCPHFAELSAGLSCIRTVKATQGLTTSLQIPAKGCPKQPQMGTQESPAPGKSANRLLSHAR